MRRRWALIAGLLLAAAGFVALGQWQWARRDWKLDLMTRVEQRIHQAPVPAPTRDDWAQVGIARDEYRRVQLSGEFLPGHDTLVQAVTELGAGHWVLTPLRRDDGSVVLVNRGFVAPAPPGRGIPVAAAPGGLITVTGLLRLTEPGGGFLRRNDPAAARWHSRDVQAIAAAQRLGAAVAPYFIDADAGPPAPPGDDRRWPVGGLTVTVFNNHHLAYALTWDALAAAAALAAAQLLRVKHRHRRRPGADQRG